MNVNLSYHANVQGDLVDVDFNDLREELEKKFQDFLEEMAKKKYKSFSLSLNLRSEPDDMW